MIQCEMLTPAARLPPPPPPPPRPGCEVSAVCSSGLDPGKEGPSPVGASGARSLGPAPRQGRRRPGAQPPLLGDRSGGRVDGHRHGGPGAARRWNAVFLGKRDFAPEWRIVWGGVSHRPLLPNPGPPSRRFLGAFRTALGSLKSSKELLP